MNYKQIILCCLMSTPLWVQAQSLKSVLGGVKDAVSSTFSSNVTSVVGTWKYVGVDCQLESDNLLAKAGSTVAEAKAKEEATSFVNKLGFTEGMVYTFQENGTYTATTAKGKTTTGKYTFDAKSKKLNLTTQGIHLNTTVNTVSSKKIGLLVNADLLLKASQMASKVAASLKKNTATSLTSSLLNKYDGMQIGIQLEKVEK